MADTPLNRVPEPRRPVPTGRLLVVMEEGAGASRAAEVVQSTAGTKAVNSRDFNANTQDIEAALSSNHSLVIERFGIAVVPTQQQAGFNSLAATLQNQAGVRQVRPEFYLFAIGELQQEFLRWAGQGVSLLARGVASGLQGARVPAVEVQAAGTRYSDTEARTWGVAAVRADRSPFTRRGIKVAVLDTGFATGHPDFAGRKVVSRSFVPGEDVEDVQGHGTHCAGTAVGPRAGTGHPRYGVAPDAELYVGKVLNNQGSGAEHWILAGIDWAIGQRCEVISMSLGRPTFVGEMPDEAYDTIGRRALEAGSLIVAAAGNESSRGFGHIAPGGSPANAPTIMAVAAVDQALGVAEFSCGGINPQGGEVNLAGPGVGIFSSVPLPERYKLLRGTSMATPHVAGLAALWAESDASLRGQKLKDALETAATDVGLSERDGGKGLAQAPGAPPLVV